MGLFLGPLTLIPCLPACLDLFRGPLSSIQLRVVVKIGKAGPRLAQRHATPLAVVPSMTCALLTHEESAPAASRLPHVEGLLREDVSMLLTRRGR